MIHQTLIELPQLNWNFPFLPHLPVITPNKLYHIFVNTNIFGIRKSLTDACRQDCIRKKKHVDCTNVGLLDETNYVYDVHQTQST